MSPRILFNDGETTMSTTDTGQPHVRFDKVQKSYDGERLVVKDLNLDIAKGEFVTMLGPSGSGKTTCLMMLAGFETVTGGEIYLAGNPINATPPHKRNIGMVFQNYALFPHMSVGENVGYPLKVRKLGKAETEEKVMQALGMVQMQDFADRMPAQLSGGQQQRIALARALVFAPQLVLMDEPLGALDKQLREHMQYEIKRIADNLGITVVYVTHDQSEALTMSDRIAVFDDGIIQQLASPSDLYERPENSFVAQFIGENNELRGMVASVSGDVAEITLADGEKVRALPVNIAGEGKPTLLSIRPERVIIDPPESDDIPTLKGKVEELIYLGDHIRCRMTVADNDEFIVKIPNDAEEKRLAAGDEIRLGWKTADCRALDA